MNSLNVSVLLEMWVVFLFCFFKLLITPDTILFCFDKMCSHNSKAQNHYKRTGSPTARVGKVSTSASSVYFSELFLFYFLIFFVNYCSITNRSWCLFPAVLHRIPHWITIYQLPCFTDGRNEISDFNDRRHEMTEIHHWPNYQWFT